jgi:hypothetical protein
MSCRRVGRARPGRCGQASSCRACACSFAQVSLRLSVRLNTSAPGVYHWLENHAAHYGFKRTVPSEAWHWEWWGGGPGGGPC